MADFKNTENRKIVLQNFEKYNYIYDLNQKKEFQKDTTPKSECRTIGNYIIVNNDFVAVYRHNTEYTFEINETTFTISPDSKLSVENLNEDERIFKFENNSTERIDYVYPRQVFVSYDAWSDEDDVDFFAWLVKLHLNGNLYSMFS